MSGLKTYTVEKGGVPVTNHYHSPAPAVTYVNQLRRAAATAYREQGPDPYVIVERSYALVSEVVYTSKKLVPPKVKEPNDRARD